MHDACPILAADAWCRSRLYILSTWQNHQKMKIEHVKFWKVFLNRNFMRIPNLCSDWIVDYENMEKFCIQYHTQCHTLAGSRILIFTRRQSGNSVHGERHFCWIQPQELFEFQICVRGHNRRLICLDSVWSACLIHVHRRYSKGVSSGQESIFSYS